MSPIAPVAHLIGIALGVFGGFWLGGVVAPDLPSAETEPGVALDSGVEGADADSLYHPGPLQAAVTQTVDQLGPGAEVSSVTIEPTTLNATDAGDGETAPLESMPVEAPERIAAGLEAAREDAGVRGQVTLDDVKELTWTPANPTAGEWYVLLDIATIGPPTEFSASRDGSKVTAGTP